MAHPSARRIPLDPAEIRRIAKHEFGYESLRPGQEQTVGLVLQGHDVLSIMPTGSGKSAIYQICGMLLDGPTVIISPLLALQKDQKEAIEEIGIGEAAVVNASQRVGERREAFEKLERGSLSFSFYRRSSWPTRRRSDICSRRSRRCLSSMRRIVSANGEMNFDPNIAGSGASLRPWAIRESWR